jgi:hypothetical protein
MPLPWRFLQRRSKRSNGDLTAIAVYTVPTFQKIQGFPIMLAVSGSEAACRWFWTCQKCQRILRTFPQSSTALLAFYVTICPCAKKLKRGSSERTSMNRGTPSDGWLWCKHNSFNVLPEVPEVQYLVRNSRNILIPLGLAEEGPSSRTANPVWSCGASQSAFRSNT